MTTLSGMYNQMSPTFGAADALLRDYESKAPFWFRWSTSLIEHIYTLLVLVSLIIRYVWNHTITPILSWFYIPLIRKRIPISFQNETVLITGAGGCLGRALAIELAREARCIALLDVQKKPLDDLKQSLQQIYGKEHCRIYTYRCDLSDLNALKYTITAIREEMGDNISVLINCAATAHFKDIVSHTDDEYQYTLIVNTLAPILITKDLLGGMIARNHGQIVNIVSSGALSGNAFSSSYSSSKAALLNFTETLSQELILAKATGVRVTAVLPFYLDGGIYTTLRKYGKEKVLGVTPQRFDVAAREIMVGLKSGRKFSVVGEPTGSKGTNYHIMNTVWDSEYINDQSPTNPQYNGYNSPDYNKTYSNTIPNNQKQSHDQYIYAVNINEPKSKPTNSTDTMVSWTQQLQEQLKTKKPGATSASSTKQLIHSSNSNNY